MTWPYCSVRSFGGHGWSARARRRQVSAYGEIERAAWLQLRTWAVAVELLPRGEAAPRADPQRALAEERSVEEPRAGATIAGRLPARALLTLPCFCRHGGVDCDCRCPDALEVRQHGFDPFAQDIVAQHRHPDVTHPSTRCAAAARSRWAAARVCATCRLTNDSEVRSSAPSPRRRRVGRRPSARERLLRVRARARPSIRRARARARAYRTVAEHACRRARRLSIVLSNGSVFRSDRGPAGRRWRDCTASLVECLVVVFLCHEATGSPAAGAAHEWHVATQ